MSPILPALALVACFALALRAVALMRDRGPEGRLVSVGARLRPGPGARPGPYARLLDRLGGMVVEPLTAALGESRLADVRHRLDAAGRPGGMTVRTFVARRASLALLFGGAGLVAALSSGSPLFLLYPLVGWLLTNAWLARIRRRRQARIDRDLPDYLDIVAVSVGAGVGFRPALERAARGIGGPIEEEILAWLRELQLGAGRREALEALRERNDSEFLGRFVASLLEAEELGAPLGDALRALARDMRSSAYQRARTQAQKAESKIGLITIGTILPASMILLIGALVTQVAESFRSGLG